MINIDTLKALASLAALGAVWSILQAFDINVPTMQSYNFSLGWKDKCRLCRWSLEYIRMMLG